MPSPVDISYEALKYLSSIGYSRLKFLLSENSHDKPDICDTVAGKFKGSSFATLNSVLSKAPVFGSNPPAPIYGLTHPACRCSYLVYPPATVNELVLPGNPNPQQKEEVLKHMYPQQIWASSKVPVIKDIDFSQFVNVTPVRPKRKNGMDDQPWYQETWNWIKTKIFRKANTYADLVRYAHEKTAASNVKIGDIAKLIDDDKFVSEFGIETPIPNTFTGLVLGDYNDKEVFMYIVQMNSVLPVRKDRLLRLSNKDIQHPYVGRRVKLSSKDFPEPIEGVVFRVMDNTAWVYDFLAGDFQYIPKSELQMLE